MVGEAQNTEQPVYGNGAWTQGILQIDEPVVSMEYAYLRASSECVSGKTLDVWDFKPAGCGMLDGRGRTGRSDQPTDVKTERVRLCLGDLAMRAVVGGVVWEKRGYRGGDGSSAMIVAEPVGLDRDPRRIPCMTKTQEIF